MDDARARRDASRKASISYPMAAGFGVPQVRSFTARHVRGGSIQRLGPFVFFIARLGRGDGNAGSPSQRQAELVAPAEPFRPELIGP
jgi:hypothetical protein